MIKNIKRFLKDSEKKRRASLNALSIRKAVKILENLISSNLLKALIVKPKETPISLERSLKHARLSR